MRNDELIFLKAIEKIRNEHLTKLFEAITFLGEETLLVIIICVIYFAFSTRLAKRLTFITLSSLALNSTIKNIFKIPRPFFSNEIQCIRPDTATGYSFPSGHTQNFATWSSSFAFIFNKKTLLFASVILTVLVAFSRMYLGAHYPSDVITGGLLGLLISYFCNKAYEASKKPGTFLYTILFIILIPFAIMFFISTDILCADFFKIYGMIFGFSCAVTLEEKYIKYECIGNCIQKILRIIVAIIVAFLVKKSTGILQFYGDTHLIFIKDFISYFILTFAVFGLCPYIFKKIKL